MQEECIYGSKHMDSKRAQIPLRITPEFVKSATYRIEKIDRNCGYQAEAKFKAAERWLEAIRKNEYVWMGISGAATPAGLGGLIADAISMGLIDVVVSTGANAYHDEHFAYCLPIRHGTDKADDNELKKEGVTRIYTQNIHNKYTLKAQDMINQGLGRRIFYNPSDKSVTDNEGIQDIFGVRILRPPFSTAEMMHRLGKEIAADERAVDKHGSFLVRAAEYDVPVFLDSSSNHSLAMDFSALSLEGYEVDPSASRDLIQTALLTIKTQPQLNIFLGEGGPRNFVQTTAPTACEIFGIPFEGSAGCIKFTTADQRTGGLSGSTESEAVTWGKYLDTNPEREIEVWGEYTLTAPDVIAYVAGKAISEGILGLDKPKRLMTKLPFIHKEGLELIRKYEKNKIETQLEISRNLEKIVEHEKEARRKAGYEF